MFQFCFEAERLKRPNLIFFACFNAADGEVCTSPIIQAPIKYCRRKEVGSLLKKKKKKYSGRHFAPL